MLLLAALTLGIAQAFLKGPDPQTLAWAWGSSELSPGSGGRRASRQSSPPVAFRLANPPIGPDKFYTGNRAPLTPSALRKLPIGAIKPLGWIRTQLQLEAEGFVGHLTEISPWLQKKNNAWLSPEGQ